LSLSFIIITSLSPWLPHWQFSFI